MEHRNFFNSAQGHGQINFVKIKKLNQNRPRDISLHKIKLTDRQDGESHFAILHTLESEERRQQANFYKEFANLKKFDHENIIALIGWRLQPDQGIQLFVTEYYDQTVRDYLVEFGTPNSEIFFSWAQQSLNAIVHLHQHDQEKTVHGDIRSNNFFIIGNQIKIGGFSYSKNTVNTISSCTAENQLYENTGWQPLEVLRDNEVSPESDIYSFVTFLWELISGEIPYGKQTKMAIMKNLDRTQPIQPEIPTNCPRALRELLKAGWTRNANERPSLINIRDRLRKMEDKGIDVTGGNVPTHDNSALGVFILGVFIIGAVLALVFVFFKG